MGINSIRLKYLKCTNIKSNFNIIKLLINIYLNILTMFKLYIGNILIYI